ncbi:aspartate aminotransferase [Penicillium robsamsonii]|uniref:aspartate aminotransferase n=1 Tax=Penicillium robsamsonii TaxID=1792511 RepID=UPI002546F3BF|nr:aspartate aminotransferase [Penicillium robsamsonii]KAJ5816978.1 aspartate aminotransferase [Penicillium robsamsonii]
MEGNLSVRGKAFAAQKPTFLDVLSDLWAPEANPDGIVNIGLAENSLMHAEMERFINSHSQIDAHALTYGDGFSGSHKLKEAVCHFLNSQFSPWTALCPSHLAITCGVSNAVECCAWALADFGDYILVGRPYFNAFKTTFGTRPGIELLEVTFATTDPFSLAAVQHYEKTYAEAKSKGFRVKALLLCSPHNPLGVFPYLPHIKVDRLLRVLLGRCYPENVLREYMKFCTRNGLHLICDEIYAMSVWENPRLPDAPGFKSILSLNVKDLMDPSMVHVVWGLSKDFGATGLRIGCLVSQANGPLLEAADGISLYNFPSSLADQVATTVLLDDKFTRVYIATNRHRLAESYRFATDFLRFHHIPYVESNAAFFVWMNLRAALKDRAATDKDILARLRKEKVYIAVGTAYAAEEVGWFRMVFAHPRNVLEEGLNRMLRAIQS